HANPTGTTNSNLPNIIDLPFSLPISHPEQNHPITSQLPASAQLIPHRFTHSSTISASPISSSSAWWGQSQIMLAESAPKEEEKEEDSLSMSDDTSSPKSICAIETEIDREHGG